MSYTIALDVHKRETQACIADETGHEVQKRFRTSPKSFQRALGKYGPCPVVLECVGFYRPITSWLEDMGMEVHVANVARIPKPKVKTDKKDAHHLLRLWRGDSLPESYLPPNDVHKLRDLTRHRIYLAAESRRFKGKVKHDLYKHGHFVDANPLNSAKGRTWIDSLPAPEIASSKRVWESLQQEIQDFQARIETITTTNPYAQRLMTIPGVGAYTALVVLAEVGDFARFQTGDQLANYAGLTPSVHQSGDNARTGQITKQGNPILRFILVEAAHSHVRHCPESTISQRHRRLAEKKGAGKAAVATARQLLTVMKVMIDRNEDFQVNP